MKITGLITEYNPFHNGHLYHIRRAKEITGADAVIVVMSGDFVQRGEPAIMSKEVRTKAALSVGASVVFELPVIYATGSAEIFALGAVSLLDALGCVDSICFGTECGNIDVLSRIADILAEEPEEFQQILHNHLGAAKSFPVSREEALVEYMKKLESENEIRKILHNPNNILGIEYIKALKRIGSCIKPYAIKREGAAYHEDVLMQGDIQNRENELSRDSMHACENAPVKENLYEYDDRIAVSLNSATAIRRVLKSCEINPGNDNLSGEHKSATNKAIQTGELYSDRLEEISSQLSNSIPKEALDIYKEYLMQYSPATWKDYTMLMKYRLQEECCQSSLYAMNGLLNLHSMEDSSDRGLCAYMDISKSLAHRMEKYLESYTDPETFIEMLKTKDITYTRISRALLHVLLRIKKVDYKEYAENGMIFYARLLGFKKEDAAVLGEIKKNGRIPILSKLADADETIERFFGKTTHNNISLNAIYARKMLRQDIFASEVYDSAQALKGDVSASSELRKKIIIV